MLTSNFQKLPRAGRVSYMFGLILGALLNSLRDKGNRIHLLDPFGSSIHLKKWRNIIVDSMEYPCGVCDPYLEYNDEPFRA